MQYDYDIIVVGGGHAGCEASHIAAKMGKKTLLITLNFNKVANMPCNPSIGGSAKGIVVREIDALGGLMGKIADIDYLQMKMLNTGKGPGVQCLRAQQDKINYPKNVLKYLRSVRNLELIEGCVTKLFFDNNQICGVILDNNKIITSKCVILTTGTYMESNILVGHEKIITGPDGEKPSLGLSPYLKSLGLNLFRLKTGTPQRIKRSSIDFSKAKIENGTKGNFAFSFETEKFIPLKDQVPCYLIYTNSKTHEIINKNLDKSAMYSGLVKGIGPRYCPSIEDKIVRFKDKPRHQLFLEPESRYTDSIYLQGFSTSMPREVQLEMVHSLEGLENAIILKYAYAIEYDALDPTQLDLTLMVKKYPGLYCAGQICGTSGYEEAAGLGIIAGINACLKIDCKKPFILKRNEAYIGVMIDDIVNKGTNEPYRLLSSRAEFRLLLRSDNADQRLREYAKKLKTISKDVYDKYKNKMNNINKIINLCNNTHIGINPKLTDYMILNFNEDYKKGISLSNLIKRPGIKLEEIINFFDCFNIENFSQEEIDEAEILLKYEGYIKKQENDALKLKKLDNVKLPKELDYFKIDGLALEARSKLDKIRPISIGQASRISGINPSDIVVLNLYLNKKR